MTQNIRRNDTQIPERFQKNSSGFAIESIFLKLYNSIIKNYILVVRLIYCLHGIKLTQFLHSIYTTFGLYLHF